LLLLLQAGNNNSMPVRMRDTALHDVIADTPRANASIK